MYLYSLVFVCGASVMIIEIVSARFFAPFFGTSVAVWTGVIGVIMAGLSVGYALGGYLGDRWKSLDRLRMIIAGAGAWTLLLIVLRGPVLRALAAGGHSQASSAVVGSFVLLIVPAVLLGIVSPYCVRLATRDTEHAGRTAGRLSALSTCGSILGTFLAGFFLVPSAGVSVILAGTGFVLLALAGVERSWRGGARVVVAFFCMTLVLRWHAASAAEARATEGIVFEADTPYSAVAVKDMAKSFWGDNIRLLMIDSGYHGAMQRDDPSTLVYHYTRAYRLADALRPDGGKALLLGGGVFTVARDYLTRHPAGSIDVVEIDPVVIDAARTYFGLEDDPRMTIVEEDARTFTRREAAVQPGRYQIVFGDVFRSRHTVPFHLTTRETAAEIATLLDDQGVYLLNVIASEQGEGSAFLHSTIRTLQDVFPSVLAVRSSPATDDLTEVGNYLVLASKVPVDIAQLREKASSELRPMLARFVSDADADTANTAGAAGAIVLTDEYAPVEQMVQW